MPPVLIACPVTGDLVPTGETVASLDELEANTCSSPAPTAVGTTSGRERTRSSRRSRPPTHAATRWAATGM
jgi:hypothetical protein